MRNYKISLPVKSNCPADIASEASAGHIELISGDPQIVLFLVIHPLRLIRHNGQLIDPAVIIPL